MKGSHPPLRQKTWGPVYKHEPIRVPYGSYNTPYTKNIHYLTHTMSMEMPLGGNKNRSKVRTAVYSAIIGLLLIFELILLSDWLK